MEWLVIPAHMVISETISIMISIIISAMMVAIRWRNTVPLLSCIRIGIALG